MCVSVSVCFSFFLLDCFLPILVCFYRILFHCFLGASLFSNGRDKGINSVGLGG